MQNQQRLPLTPTQQVQFRFGDLDDLIDESLGHLLVPLMLLARTRRS
jgi:hypothetical protein